MLIRNTFRKSQRLCSRTLIEQLFAHSGSKSATAYPIRAVFRKADSGQTQILLSVPKRLFKHAVDRNRVKRQLREAYRTQYLDLLPKEQTFHIAFIWLSDKHHPSGVINAKMRNLLNRIAETCENS